LLKPKARNPASEHGEDCRNRFFCITKIETDFCSVSAHLQQHKQLDSLLQCFYNVDTFKGNTFMQAVIRKWGNSPALRLPSAVLKEAGYEIEQKVELHVTRGRIVIQPLEKLEYDLDVLVMGMNAKNKHDEASFGAAVGKEML
jgi:antitoxin MazE